MTAKQYKAREKMSSSSKKEDESNTKNDTDPDQAKDK